MQWHVTTKIIEYITLISHGFLVRIKEITVPKKLLSSSTHFTDEETGVERQQKFSKVIILVDGKARINTLFPTPKLILWF